MDLWRNSITASPFQHPGWLLPWWLHFGSGQLALLSDRRTFLLPMFLHEWEGRRQWTLLGTGISDHLDVLAGPDFRIEAVADWLQEQRHKWDLCDWQDLPKSSPLLNLPRVLVDDAASEMFVPFPSSPEALVTNLPHGLRRNLRRYQQALGELGEVRFETSQDTIDGHLIREWFRLHTASWHLRGSEGVLNSESLLHFHLESAQELSQSGLSRFYLLLLDDKLVAILYAWIHNGSAYGYLGGFDGTLARCSPGSLLLAHAMQDALKEGACEWRFLRGDEPYKTAWGAQKTSKQRLRLHSAL